MAGIYPLLWLALSKAGLYSLPSTGIQWASLCQINPRERNTIYILCSPRPSFVCLTDWFDPEPSDSNFKYERLFQLVDRRGVFMITFVNATAQL
jgi:hypothetical protein